MILGWIDGKKISSQKYQVRIEARERYHLSNKQIQMVGELDLNPHKLGKSANEKQEPYMKPLPEFVKGNCFKRFKKSSQLC